MKNSILSLFALLAMCSGYASEERFAEKPRYAGFPQLQVQAAEPGKSWKELSYIEDNPLPEFAASADGAGLPADASRSLGADKGAVHFRGARTDCHAEFHRVPDKGSQGIDCVCRIPVQGKRRTPTDHLCQLPFSALYHNGSLSPLAGLDGACGTL